MADTLGVLNPLTYRGYVYDHDTGLYYLQSRYYHPQWGRFLNTDSYTSTGQGLLGNNMFAYCRNNPVCRVDISGTADEECFKDDELFSSDDLEAHGGGGGSWDIFLRTLQSAADGLSMAMGQRNYSKSQLHHVVPHSHKKYSPEHKEIADRYNYELASQENIISLNGHCGRHTMEYQDFISLGLNELNRIAMGSKSAFHEGMGIIKEFVKNNPWLPYAKTRK